MSWNHEMKGYVVALVPNALLHSVPFDLVYAVISSATHAFLEQCM